ncbi:ABC transporter ATP-binding protein [Paenibacillus sp. FSL F4-0236]|uniref:ABC transporter ATP-binding protein n=1 Tax=unclassified Paenibacillus TaxID=185978 RepID=UPI0030F9EC89
MSKELAIRAENITKVYKLYEKPIHRLKESLSIRKMTYHRPFYALNDVSMEIYRGEVVGIIGKNGSGKSTILKIITGVSSPTSGGVYVNGKISALLELGAGFNLEYTGIENIYLNGMMMGFGREEMDAKLNSILEFADIGDFVYQPVKAYSSGMFARLAFSVAINVDPEILIVDEALAVGDLKFQIKCMEKFSEFRDKGKTILFVSHDINSIKRYCNRAIWLNSGRIEAQGDTDLICDRYTDYLKYGEKSSKSNEDEGNKGKLKLNDDMIGVIEGFQLIDTNGKEIDEIEYNSNFNLKIDFEMNTDDLDIVIGVAIHTIDDIYVCGVNTLLDKEKISYKKGMNTIYLEYEEFNLLGGSYYFDVAIFENNAHVPIDYRARIKEFFVRAAYIGEGICVLPHKWKMDGD